MNFVVVFNFVEEKCLLMCCFLSFLAPFWYKKYKKTK